MRYSQNIPKKYENFEVFLVNYLVQEESDLDLSEVQPKHTEKTENFEVFFSKLPCIARKFRRFFSELCCSGGI